MWQKSFFFIILIFGTMISISSNSWLGAWLGLEINLISFIPLMYKNNNLLSLEASLIYFINQALASSILLYSIMMYINYSHNYFFFFNLNYYSIIMVSLMLKIGSAPLHFWLPLVMEGLNWMNNLILMTWQKLAPFILISYILQINLIYLFIIFSTTIGSLGGFNQTSLRKILAFSSISHISWMLTTMINNMMMWKMYFLLYSFTSMNLILLFKLFNLFYFNQLFSMNFKNLNLKFLLFINILSLGGLPPFLGFFPKMMIIQLLSENNQYLILMIMISFTLITLYFYIRLMYTSFMMNLTQIKNINLLEKLNLNNKSNMLIKFNYMNNFSLMIMFMSLYYM